MPIQSSPKTRAMERKRMREDQGFDVTCVIGRVRIGDNGEHSPHQAAFLLIAEHDAPGVFSFPGADGREVQVTVGGPAYEPNSDQ